MARIPFDAGRARSRFRPAPNERRALHIGLYTARGGLATSIYKARQAAYLLRYEGARGGNG